MVVGVIGSEPHFHSFFTKNRLRKTFEEKILNSSTRGKDGIYPSLFEKTLDDQIEIIHHRVLSGSYNFTTYKQKLIPKSEHSNRVISVPTVRDRLLLRVMCDYLNIVFQDCVPVTTYSIIPRMKEDLHLGYNYIVRIDVKKFYDSINHKILLGSVKSRIQYINSYKIIESAIKNGTGIEKNTPNRSVGVPQGLSISNILAGIFMSPIDHAFESKYRYYRYVDDILILTKFSDPYQIFDDVSNVLNEVDLAAHPLPQLLTLGLSKSCVAARGAPVDYLGFIIKETKLSIRDSSIAKLIQKINGVFTRSKYTKNKRWAVWRLNLKILAVYWTVREKDGYFILVHQILCIR